MVYMCLPCTHYNDIVIPWGLLVDGADLVCIILFLLLKGIASDQFFSVAKITKNATRNFSTRK